MSVYAISDLHLSLNTDKPMDIFGEKWINHDIKIKKNWNEIINNEDYVLIAGDISWALKFNEAKEDLEFIHNLKGKKIILKGNHDYWWTSISKLNSLYDDMFFIQNNYYKYNDIGICGTRGWVNLNGKEHDEKIYNRELIRLKISLDAAKNSGLNNYIVMMHYPPVSKINVSREFIDLLHGYGVKKVIYGHIHESSKEICVNGYFEDIEFICTSADIINFKPIRII